MIAKKVLLVGNFGVGKTSLIRRFVLNEFSEDYISTIGVRVSTKIVKFKEEEIKLLIWDVAGVSDNDKIPKAYFLGSSAAMYVFDLSREETYKNIKNQIENVKELSGLKNITVVGNKKDLLATNEIKQVIESISISVDLITSAKDDENVEDAFIKLANQSLTK
jgi:small GTP-binding protein